MSGRSSEIAIEELNELIEEYDGDYWRAIADTDGPYDLTSYRDEEGVLWDRIPGFSDYEISWDGRVKSYIHKNPRILKPWHSSNGYPYVQLYGDDGVKHKFTVHSLVANTFCYNPDPENYKIVRHMDDNPKNNNWTNLRFGTPAMNHQDMVDHGREFTKPVYCYEKNYIYNSAAEAAEDLGATRAGVSKCCHGVSGIVNGFHVCFATDMDERLSHLEEWLDDSKSYGFKKLEATNLETGEKIIFGSRKEASEFTGVPDCSISSSISGLLKQSHGWTFKDLSGGGE